MRRLTTVIAMAAALSVALTTAATAKTAQFRGKAMSVDTEKGELTVSDEEAKPPKKTTVRITPKTRILQQFAQDTSILMDGMQVTAIGKVTEDPPEVKAQVFVTQMDARKPGMKANDKRVMGAFERDRDEMFIVVKDKRYRILPQGSSRVLAQYPATLEDIKPGCASWGSMRPAEAGGAPEASYLMFVAPDGAKPPSVERFRAK